MTSARHRKAARRIAVVTGTRAEYGLLRTTMEAVAGHRGLTLQVVVTGMHLLRKFGRTIDDIIRDGWRVDARVKMQAGDDSPLDQAAGLSRGVRGIATYCQQAATDIVVVLGDRIEAMAGALAAVTTGRLLAHVHGGDIAPGDFDDSLRHAISKLAHLHLTATESARRRLIRMGESPERVHCVGAPGLDRLLQLLENRRGPKEGGGRALVVYHPSGRSPARERRTMKMILEAVDAAALQPTIIYPNSDRGHTGVIEAVEARRKQAKAGPVRVVRSLTRDEYLDVLIDADLLIGNSSSGIIEAGTAGTPAVNVGPRQRGRQPSGGSVVHADESAAAIREALRKALRKRPIIGGRTVYGEGTAGKHIAALLATVPLDDSYRRKTNAY
jgi:UDP-N-acetylglucosamine 2-epimerase (non-hydrolysing)/GDP/UDP-N,N'-diacetylbacillosamine 2-epimerase (hydrolysing)